MSQVVCTLAPKCLCKDYLEPNVYTIWVHGPLALLSRQHQSIAHFSFVAVPYGGFLGHGYCNMGVWFEDHYPGQ